MTQPFIGTLRQHPGKIKAAHTQRLDNLKKLAEQAQQSGTPKQPEPTGGQ